MISERIKVLMIGSDRKLFEVNSVVSERMKEYGTLVEELHIIVFATKSLGLRQKQIAPNVWIYPTNSLSRWLYPLDAIRIGKNIKASMVTTQDPFESGWAGLKLKKILNIPLEVQLHTDPYSPHFKGVLNWIRKIIMKKVMKEADHVRNVLGLPIYIDKIKIEGEAKFDLHDKYGFKTVLLMVSRLSREKNIGLALRALEKVREMFPETGLVVVGSGLEELSLKLKVKSLKLEGAVEFVGWQEDLASYYKTADIFLQTSRYEGYGLSLVEAGLSGLPVISTPVGIAVKLKNIFIANTAEELAHAIITIKDKDLSGLKQELETRVLNKEEYLKELKSGWEKTVSMVK